MAGWVADVPGRQDEPDTPWVTDGGGLFAPDRPVYVARAPGRLDVMGGIADYSGALVLELPIAAATWVAAQPCSQPEVVIETDDASVPDGARVVTLSLAQLLPERPLGYERARALLTGDPRRAWAAYVAGALVVLHAELGRRLSGGLRLLIRSEVPVGKGLSSSAALEVATLEVVAPLMGATLTERALALLAQKIENHVVGAPCGVMDQMTSAGGRCDHLLELVCQPAEVKGQLPVPPDVAFLGVDSGIRHAVSGADYGTVRAAAFMGYRMIAAATGIRARRLSPGRVALDDTRFNGYLANVPAADWRTRYCHDVPEQMLGSDFLAGFQGTPDATTVIEPARRYPVRAATAHAIEENERVHAFRALLADKSSLDEETRIRLGALMYASHASYSACGLGSEGTDRLVDLVRQAGPRAGLYGAKITGGGSGGTVAVLAARNGREAVAALAEQYRRSSGRDAAVYAGSSDGARAFGVRRLRFSGPPTPPV